MRYQWLVPVFFGFCLVLVSCGVDDEKKSLENTFIVVDSASNRAVSLYETDSNDRVIRTQTFTGDGYIKRSRDFSYDKEGYVTEMKERVAGKEERTIHYNREVSLDANGRVENVITTDSTGKKLEYRYGYDEKGILRQSAVVINDDAAMFKEYPDD
jgi:hypothetical protein